MRGRITDKGSGAAIPRAELLLVTEGRLVPADPSGRFALVDLPAGELHLRVLAPGYPATDIVVTLHEGDDVELPIALDSTAVGRPTQRLAPIAVTDVAPVHDFRLVEFERRRRTGIGQYLTEEEIRASGAASLQDATRAMRGLTLHCGGSEWGGCRIQIVRARINCEPQYLVDGQVDNAFGPLTPIDDIVALEVYTGPSDVPGEFAGTRAGCGVIAIWTRSRPSRRRR